MQRTPLTVGLLLVSAVLAGCAGETATTALTIEYPDGTSEHHTVPFDAGDAPAAARFAADGAVHPGRPTPLDQLELAQVPYEATHSDFGYFVTSINGTAPQENQFWKLVHNGQDAQVGPGSLTLAAGDRVTWMLQSFTPMAPLDLQAVAATGQTTLAETTLAVSVSRPAQVDVFRQGARITGMAVDAGANITIPLVHGKNVLRVVAADESVTTQTDVVVVRLSQATVEVRFNDPRHEDRDDTLWFDITSLPSAATYADRGMDHPGNATIHDVMVAWERSTGIPVAYAYDDSFGYSVTHIDGAGNPVAATAPPWWCYEVNGEAATAGISVQAFTPGDTVRWDLGDCGFVPS